ncbi:MULTISPECIES: hypothetical protein [unclassified Paenibacillus]|uniref:hypothetical protein n=1 Tax=unclassified Paenibacillus TaxID=185978 RepID=UPI00115FDF4E|nr:MULTISPECIES: hypothetical protein [unclassified Paenibacillus]
MTPISKKLIQFLAVIFLFVLIYVSVHIWGFFAIQKKTESFLAAVQALEFERAAQLYSGTEDKQAWVRGMEQLHEEGQFRLISYAKVKPYYNDGGFHTGHAELSFDMEGEQLNVNAVLTFGENDQPGQVCAIHPPEVPRGSIPGLVSWNRLTCGGSF